MILLIFFPDRNATCSSVVFKIPCTKTMLISLRSRSSRTRQKGTLQCVGVFLLKKESNTG